MLDRLENLANMIDRLNERVGRWTAWLTTLLVVMVCYEVLSRQLGWVTTWVTELEWHLFALIFLLGAGYAFKHDRHVRVDLFYTRYTEKDRALADFIGNVVFLIPWCIVIIYTAYWYAYESFKVNEGSPDPGGLPARYVIKFSIVIGMLLLLLQGISSTIRAWLTLRGRRAASESDDQNIQE
jgi:TRAP-type mannitol/chloroaromatic compound transport system permease small subunit